MRTIGIIPARCGSKGILLKNIYPIQNKPMILYGISALQQSMVKDIYVSTNCQEIANICLNNKVNIINRPQEISQDSSPTIDCIKHCISELKLDNTDTVVLVQPTSPLILSTDINNGINLFNSGLYSAVISVTENHNILWEQKDHYLIPRHHNPHARIRRQDMSVIVAETGAFYIFKVINITKNNSIYGNGLIGGVNIPKSRSFEIDNYDDIKIVESLLNEK